MRHIIVSKFGNEPDIFGDSLRCGMIGDWESRKLLQVLASDPNDSITYYGRAKWDDEKAKEHFPNNNVQYIEASLEDDTHAIFTMTDIDEFHIILGPHAIYNGANKFMSSWESIKTSIVTQRMLDRVAPQIRLMNDNMKASAFFYLSDRRFLLMTAELQLRRQNVIYAQSLGSFYHNKPRFNSNEYTSMYYDAIKVQPFRFETLWLYGKSYEQFKKNQEDSKRLFTLIVPANQVTSDKEIDNSRGQKILDLTKYLTDVTVCGKWTEENIRHSFKRAFDTPQYLDGLSMVKYNELLKQYQYALVTFNTKDSIALFVDNWLTVKYWECVYNGCITFVEATYDYIPFIPKELQVKSSEELRDKLRLCESSIEYKNKLKQLQFNLVKPEYFSGKYFIDYINNERRFYDRTLSLVKSI